MTTGRGARTFWSDVREDPGAAALVLAAGSVVVGAGLAALLPAVERGLLARHHGTDLAAHVVLLPWPSMYSYDHTLRVRPRGTSTAPDCRDDGWTLRHPHMPFGALADVVGLLDACGYDGAAVQIESHGRWTTRHTEIELTRDVAWSVRW